MKKLLSLFLFVSLFGCSSKVNLEAETKAIRAAETWLDLVDNGKYAESWEQSAQYFQSAIAKDEWEKTISVVRNPLGKVVSRELKNKSYKTTLPGAPDGEYVIIQYKTSFENKKFVVETVTPMLDNDGNWKVSGYYIK